MDKYLIVLAGAGMGGLAAAVGLVIDDAIVVVENIVLHRDAGEDRMEAIHSALNELIVPLLGSTPPKRRNDGHEPLLTRRDFGGQMPRPAYGACRQRQS